MTVVQKTIIDTLHKEGRPQTFIAKEAGCSQSAVSKHVNRKLSGRKKFGRKRCQPTERTAALWGLETKVLESGGRVEKLIAQVAWSSVLSFHNLWWFGVQCHLLVLVYCVFWRLMSLHPFTKKFWSTSCFLLLTSFLKMLISFSSRIWHLPTLPKAPKVG